MLAWIFGFAYGGGEQAIETDARNTLFVDFEDTTLHVIRDSYDLKTIYVDKGSSQRKRISQNWTRWLDGSTIASVVWEVENSSTAITLSDASFNSSVVVNHVNSNDSAYGLDLHLKATITTSDTPPQIESRSFLIRTVRTH